MPDIKHQFTGGKMNKDLDERLVPKGEYRDAMNIQVSTSEGSDVGTVQNILGNSEIANQGFITSSAICVGAIADEKNDKLYWFIKDTSFDGIFEYTSGGTTITPVLIDTNSDVLKFNSSKIITGINVIDDMLFWTDNQNEPRKINIPRSIANTSGTTHTDFENEETGLYHPIKEEHITVIKKHPTIAPTVKLLQERGNDEGMIYTGVMKITSKPEPMPAQHYTDKDTGVQKIVGYSPWPYDGISFGQRVGVDWNETNLSSMWMPRSVLNHHYDFSQLQVGDYFDAQIETDINGESGFKLDWKKTDTILFEAFGGDLNDQAPEIPLRNYSLKARIRNRDHHANTNIAIPKNDYDANGAGIAITLGDSPEETFTNSVTWVQDPNHLKDIHFQARKGFDGRMNEVHLYEVVDGIPYKFYPDGSSADLCPNPYFQLTDVTGNVTGAAGTDLPQWFCNSACVSHGIGTAIGAQYSTNPNYVDNDGNGPTTALPVAGNGQPAYIDPALFPCYPGNYHFGIYPPTDPRHIDDGAWHIVHSDNLAATGNNYGITNDDSQGGFAQHGGRGFDKIQQTTQGDGPDNYGGLISPAGTQASTSRSFSRQAGGVPPPFGTSGMGTSGNGYGNWLYHANDLPSNDSSYVGASDGNVYPSSYSIMNQNGYIYIKMDGTSTASYGVVSGEDKRCVEDGGTLQGPGCFGGGRTYMLEMTFTDTGHTYGQNGGITMGGAGIVNPWDNPLYYTDQPLEIIQNGNFFEPDGNGDLPKHWNADQVGSVNICAYNPAERHVIFGASTTPPFIASNKFSHRQSIKIEDDTTYEISFELFDVDINSEGIFVGIVGEYYSVYNWETPEVDANGIYNFTVTTVTPSPLYSAGNLTTGLESGHSVYFEARTMPGASANGLGFIGKLRNVSVRRQEAPDANVSCEVLAIHNPPVAPEGGELRFAVDLEPVRNKIYEFKFPRFAYRYQYGDNEYSAMSPFSPVAFVPGDFRYHPKEGFNLAMTNRLIKAEIKDFMLGIPDGVIAIDILYKDDKSPNVYIVDTIKPKHSATIPFGTTTTSAWVENEYVISSEQISSMLTSNQLLRPWDAVPLKALAQDVTGSRIVYGNYVQGFDLEYNDGTDNIEKYYPDFKFDILSSDNLGYNSEKSIKSLREYQLGIVFADEYGRETPVISNSSGTRALEKTEGKKINKMQVGFNNVKFPNTSTLMKYFKFFVKETSNEYYNLAMDRWYDAEDGGAWLAFPSSDRNKVDIDTFLFLKKATDSNVGIVDETKYKILDIQSNAPSFIKQKKTLVSTVSHVAGGLTDIFGANLVDAPRVGDNEFKMNYKPFHDSSGSNLDEITDGNLWIDFKSVTGSITKRYRISKITNDYSPLVAAGGEEVELDVAQYSVILTEGFDSDIDLITDDPLTGFSASKIKDGTVVNIYKYNKEDQAKFDGRFFAKISVDLEFFKTIITSGTGSGIYRPVSSKKLYYLSSDNSALHDSALTGQDEGLYAGGFGRFAPFFRNYNRAAAALTYDNDPVGQYAFGPGLSQDDPEKPWLQELAYYTTVGGTYERANLEGNVNLAPNPKKADSHGWDSSQREGVFTEPTSVSYTGELQQQTHGDVWFIDGGPFYGENPLGSGDNLHWANGAIKLINEQSGAESGGIDETGNDAFFNIAVGGIYNGTPDVGDADVISSFFDLRSGANTGYGENTQELVERISPGQKFRFREDPNGDIYTIQSDVTNKRLVRWGTIGEPDITNGNVNFSWDFEDAGAWSGASPVGNDDDDNDYTVFGTQLSPNFTRGWRPRVLNSAGESAVNWNPATGNFGPITNGLKLSINLSSAFITPSSTPPNIYVEVDSLIGTDEITGLEHNITVGMIMTSHSDDGTPILFDGVAGFEPLAIHKIEDLGVNLGFKLHLTGYNKILYNSDTANTTLGLEKHNIFDVEPTESEAMIFEQPTMNGYSQYSVNRINAQDPAGMNWSGPTIDSTTGEEIDSGNPGIIAIGYNLDFLEEAGLDSDSQVIISENPAIWETEPKESIDLDLYYEASGYYPLELRDKQAALLLTPIGSTVETVQGVHMESGTTISNVEVLADGDLKITILSPSDVTGYEDPGTGILVLGALVGSPYITIGDRLKITKSNGEAVIVKITNFGTPDGNSRTTQFIISGELYGGDTDYILNWHNCYSFGNGVESNRVRDNFNLPFISNGAKVSTTFEGDYGKEHRKYGLIYSGLYNSNSGVNNLNQFIAAEKITKDINPRHGSIQKLHSRDGDLVTLCEDKCLRILANKDAVFNADGNPNLVATSNVLGQTIPFSGEFGISKNPESFASESYRAYFTDKVRGTVMRLSKDGLTPISMYGMKDWFKDNLRLSSKLIGSYDDRKDEYNITLNNSTDGDPKTVSFKEDVKGWVSFKSFVPEFGISMASNYYTMKAGRLYKHHDEGEDRNTFYNDDLVSSSVNVIFNEGPGSIKSFHTLNYEGSQSKITKFLEEEIIIDYQPDTFYNDQEYYNLSAKPGWSVGSIATDEDTGYITDFIEKEGKWFANMNKRIDIGTTNGEPISQITVKTNNKNNTNGNRY